MASQHGPGFATWSAPGTGGRGGPVVEFAHVSKSYGAVQAVCDLSFRIEPGETVAFLGPNGAGKSTSLEMLLGLRVPTAGDVQVCGLRPAQAIRGGRVGAMLQSAGFMGEVTVGEIVGLARKSHPRPLPQAEILARAGLTEIVNRQVLKLSGGQQQRLMFAMAIAGESDLIVLDEPTTGMDVETRQNFWNSMKEQAAAGRTVLFATHYLEEADSVADRILVIHRGRMLADGSAAEIKARTGARRVTFRLERFDAAAIRALPGLLSCEFINNRVHIQSSDSDATVTALFEAGYRPRDLEVGGLGLEQAFIALTNDADLDPSGSLSTGPTDQLFQGSAR